MIKIIHHGFNRYYGQCGKCHCSFTYELEDIDASHKVSCPDCGFEMIHSVFAEYDPTSIFHNKEIEN